MDIELAVLPALNKAIGENAHKPCVADEFNAGSFQRGIKCSIKCFPVLIFPMIDHMGGNTGLLRDGKAARIGIVGNSNNNLCRKVRV